MLLTKKWFPKSFEMWVVVFWEGSNLCLCMTPILSNPRRRCTTIHAEVREMGRCGVGGGGEFLYPQDGAVVSGPWEMFRLTFSPSPEPIRDDLIGDSCSGKFMTRAQLPRPWDLSAALDVTRWGQWLSHCSRHGLIHSCINWAPTLSQAILDTEDITVINKEIVLAFREFTF